jgi:hypothetical protein
MTATTAQQSTAAHPVLEVLDSLTAGLASAPGLPEGLKMGDVVAAYRDQISVHLFPEAGEDTERIAAVWSLATWLGEQPRVEADLYQGTCQYNVSTRRDGLTVNVVTILDPPSGGER